MTVLGFWSFRVVTEDCYPYTPPQRTAAEVGRCMMQSRSVGRGKRQATQRCPNAHHYQHNDIYQSTPPYRLSANVSTAPRPIHHASNHVEKQGALGFLIWAKHHLMLACIDPAMLNDSRCLLQSSELACEVNKSGIKDMEGGGGATINLVFRLLVHSREVTISPLMLSLVGKGDYEGDYG